VNLDRDLRDALRPLAGDPVADAARVLAALPSTGPPAGPPAGPATPPHPWLPWTLLGLGLALGAGAYAVLSRLGAPAAISASEGPKPAEGPKPSEASPAGPITNNDRPSGPGVPGVPDPAMARENASMLLVMAFGEIDLDEPVEGKQHLAPGEVRVRIDSSFATKDGLAGIYAYASDTALRLDQQTIARCAPDEVLLEEGRVWVASGLRGGAVRIDLGDAKAVLHSGKVMCSRAPAGSSILALAGKVDVVTPQRGTLTLGAHERLAVDVRGPQPVEKVAFLGGVTSWMTPMIEMSSDPEELADRIDEMLDAFDQGDHREEAARELLKLGPRCTPVLAKAVEKALPRDRALALETARLLGRLVDYRRSVFALALLRLEDAELRVVVFDAISRATDTDSATDAEFWRKASAQNRETAIQRWTKQLQR
jgi:hypothetical protein